MTMGAMTLRRLNGWIEPFSFEVRRLEREFDARVLDDARDRLMLDRLSCAVEGFLLDDSFLQLADGLDLRNDIERFWRSYVRSPARGASDGRGFDQLIWLFALARALEPRTAIASGAFRGSSAWALASGAPNADVHGFEVDLSRVRARPTNAVFHEGDWCSVDLGRLDPDRTLVFFDDQVDQARRVLEAWTRGLRFLVFEDNLGVDEFAAATDAPEALPKLDMLFDESLMDGDMLRWTKGGRTLSYRIDRRYFDTARTAIKAIQPLPSLAGLLGVRPRAGLTLVELEPLSP